ncbi:hypothetical protein [Pseudanabaena sp. FACHB-2040]|uniref:hypothetical protein n=1 Tax=Pseudanabaena sp. FACHB-2040 TaxID=2692859 RepID=UPI001683B74A|nr:hypothetical protein [Pseudanabaena sp. FACHB-2040]MBD2258439.1 hypothetical protein [Pseudanabaena sp. FACHB-2040]
MATSILSKTIKAIGLSLLLGSFVFGSVGCEAGTEQEGVGEEEGIGEEEEEEGEEEEGEED